MPLNHTLLQMGQASEQNWEEEQRKGQESRGKEGAWLWVGPLETLPVCKKDKIRSAGQLQMHRERPKTCKNKVVPKGRTCLHLGSTLS